MRFIFIMVLWTGLLGLGPIYAQDTDTLAALDCPELARQIIDGRLLREKMAGGDVYAVIEADNDTPMSWFDRIQMRLVFWWMGGEEAVFAQLEASLIARLQAIEKEYEARCHSG